MNTSAQAGPGPSSMAAAPASPGSPVVPGSAKQLRLKKRVINLVNPADPGDFSAQSLSPNTSLNEQHGQVQERTSTPPVPPTPTIEVHSYTPLGINKDGVRGILRPSGTPGSGNGVRFFPKNRFRIITPNQSAVTPQPPPSPASQSFLSQLLAVTIPSMSPRKPLPEPQEQFTAQSPEDSWEQPGQEGEVSLVASSVGSERSHVISEGEGDEADDGDSRREAEPWTGNPEIHSSPLGLPTEPSFDLSGQIELPSAVLQVPEDMSNLLSQRSPPSDIDSFSVADISSSKQFLRPDLKAFNALPSIPQSPAQGPVFASPSPNRKDLSIVSNSSMGLNDSNPTIKRRLSPLPEDTPAEPQTPITPAPNSKGFTSIFADMSAEQADLSWPLTRRSPAKSDVDVDDDTAFHSAIFAADISVPALSDLPQATLPASGERRTPVAQTFGNSPFTTTNTPGNATEFFDCASPTPSPSLSVPSLISNSNSTVSRTPSPLGLHPATHLARPTKALFDAHSAHTTALAAELELYRSLAGKLQNEVNERDGVLADLNLRVIEGEVWRVKVEELERTVEGLRLKGETEKKEVVMTSRLARESLSPSPSPLPRAVAGQEHVGDRTSPAEASNRDLEIRLAKALSDQEMLASQLAELQESKAQQASELDGARTTIKKMEEGERDAQLKVHKGAEELRSQLEVVIRRERALHAQLKESKGDLERYELDLHQVNAKREEGERKLERMKQVKDADEEEIGKLAVMLDQMKDARREDEVVRRRCGELEDMLDFEREKRARVEQQLEERGAEMGALEAKNEELEHELARTRADLLARLDVPAQQDLAPEIARLRSESASKDLEILNLQRRKAELKEDLEMLNIALDSKQQELELIKRKFAVKGVAGCTPLASSKRVNVNTTTPGSMISEIETPAPGKNRMPMSMTTRRSSSSMVTPSMNPLGSQGRNSRMLKSSQMLERRVSASTRRQSTMGKVEEENRPPMGSGGSLRRERVLA